MGVRKQSQRFHVALGLNTNAECICEVIINSAQMGIYLNVTKTGSNTKGYKKNRIKRETCSDHAKCFLSLG